MERLTTANLVRIGAVVVAVASIAAAVGGWVGLDVVDTTLALAPNIEDAADPSQDVVGAVDDTLGEVRTALTTLGSITERVAGSTEEAADVLDEVATLTTGRIPDALTALRDALPALIDTARVIDDTMRTLSVLGIDYRPQVPLDQAFADVEAQLQGLPETIGEQGSRLEGLASEFRATGTNAGDLANHISLIEEDLADVQAAVASYNDALAGVANLAEASEAISSLLPVARVALVILGLSGVALAFLGWRLGGRLTG